eukprot:tig00020951_g16455.t1
MLVVFVRGAEFKVNSIKSRLFIQHADEAACKVVRRGNWKAARAGFLKKLVLAFNALRTDPVYYTTIRAGKHYKCDKDGRGRVDVEILDDMSSGDVASLADSQKADGIYKDLKAFIEAGKLEVDGLRIVAIGEGSSKQVTRSFVRDEDLAFVSGQTLVPQLPTTRRFVIPSYAACANITDGYLANDDDVDFDGAVVEYSIAGELFRILNTTVPGVSRTSLHVANVTCSPTEGIVIRVVLGMPANDTSDGGLYLPEAADPDDSNSTASASSAPPPAGDASMPAGNVTAPAGNTTAPAGNVTTPGNNATAPAPAPAPAVATPTPAAAPANITRRALLASHRRLAQTSPCAPGPSYGQCLSNYLATALGSNPLFGLYPMAAPVDLASPYLNSAAAAARPAYSVVAVLAAALAALFALRRV